MARAFGWLMFYANVFMAVWFVGEALHTDRIGVVFYLGCVCVHVATGVLLLNTLQEAK